MNHLAFPDSQTSPSLPLDRPQSVDPPTAASDCVAPVIGCNRDSIRWSCVTSVRHTLAWPKQAGHCTLYGIQGVQGPLHMAQGPVSSQCGCHLDLIQFCLAPIVRSRHNHLDGDA